METSVTSEKLCWGLKEIKTSTGLSVPFLRKEIKKRKLLAKKAGRRTIVLDQDLRRYLMAVKAQ